MQSLSGVFLASAVLLVLAGAAKVRDPLSLVRALRSAGLPRTLTTAPLVRALAASEVGLGAWALLTGSRAAAALVALSYAGFTAFVALALARGGVLASCGCFGKDDTPPSRTHVVVTAALAAVAAAVAVRPIGGLVTVLGAGAAVPLLAATAAVTVLTYLVLARLPLLAAARTALTSAA